MRIMIRMVMMIAAGIAITTRRQFYVRVVRCCWGMLIWRDWRICWRISWASGTQIRLKTGLERWYVRWWGRFRWIGEGL
jgi:hypothetical protein